MHLTAKNDGAIDGWVRREDDFGVAGGERLAVGGCAGLDQDRMSLGRTGQIEGAGSRLVSAWFTVLMLCVAQVVSTIDRGLLALVVDPVRSDLGVTDLQIAILQGFSFSFLYVIAGIAMGLVADVVNRKRLLMAGIIVWSAATLASGLAESFGQMFAARLFIGVGEAVLAPCAVTMIADLFPVSRRGKPMALYVFGSMIAFGVGSVVTGFILEAAPQGAFDGIGFLEGRAPWRIAFILAGGFGLVLAAAFSEPSHLAPAPCLRP